ncbi:MAG: hypothetical protein K8L99_05780 [Anaerolineae bacterium]|nr:hypothetical protein [Anaerolineae bacterium]
MRPIVDGLEVEVGDQIAFIDVNAEQEGKRAFEQLALPGHPGFVIFSSDHDEIYRTFGVFGMIACATLFSHG